MKSRDFKQIARDSLKGNWFVAIIAGFIASLLGASVLNTYSFSFEVNFEEQPPKVQGGDVSAILPASVTADYQELWTILATVFLALSVFLIIYSIIQLTIGSAVSIGYAKFNLDIIDGSDAKIRTLFSYFKCMSTAIYTKFLGLFRVLLGFILLIVPGIVMSYSYSMTNFVLAENPDMTAREALKESKRIMKGNRWRLFCLECSFIIPVLLSILALGIPLIWVVPYIQASYAAFYNEARNNA